MSKDLIALRRDEESHAWRKVQIADLVAEAIAEKLNVCPCIVSRVLPEIMTAARVAVDTRPNSPTPPKTIVRGDQEEVLHV